jgi:PKD repeat protein
MNLWHSYCHVEFKPHNLSIKEINIMTKKVDFRLSMHRIAGLLLAVMLYSCDKSPEADFQANTTSSEVGEPITLRDLSSNDPDTWEWDFTPDHMEFMEGTNSSSQDPVIRISETGSYTVTLTATNSSGTDTESKEDYITVLHDRSPVVKVFSPGLENNQLGDNPERGVRVYLPPGYFENSFKRYPVIYLLHGFLSDHNTWWEGELGEVNIDIKEILDELISEEVIPPLIVAAPNSKNKYFGSKYTNSSTSGQWEDFITQDVVSYIDSHFRTLPDRESRGISGHSMGGKGAFTIAMKHPELFSVLYSHSAGMLDFESAFFGDRKEHLITASQLKKFTMADFFTYPLEVASCFACAPAYAPNPENPPVYGDFPITAEGEIIADTWQRWLQHDPYTMVSEYADKLKQVKILMDAGDVDNLRSSNELFAERLTELGISHEFELYAGGHYDRAAMRYGSSGFPFLALHLVHE